MIRMMIAVFSIIDRIIKMMVVVVTPLLKWNVLLTKNQGAAASYKGYKKSFLEEQIMMWSRSKKKDQRTLRRYRRNIKDMCDELAASKKLSKSSSIGDGGDNVHSS
jgi:hypothetical protein